MIKAHVPEEQFVELIRKFRLVTLLLWCCWSTSRLASRSSTPHKDGRSVSRYAPKLALPRCGGCLWRLCSRSVVLCVNVETVVVVSSVSGVQ